MKAKLIIKGKEIEIEISEEEYKKLYLSETGYERASKSDIYFYANSRGYVEIDDDNYYNADDECYESANYYSDKIIAENNARADKLMRQLRRFAVEHREPGINFNNANTAKFYIICDYENDELRATYTSYAKVFGAIYFDSREVANAAIDKFHDELIWYFNEYKDSL